MADYQDVMRAEREAEAAIRQTETTMGQIEDGERGEPYGAIVVAQSNLAVARAVLALGVRLDYVAHDLLERARR